MRRCGQCYIIYANGLDFLCASIPQKTSTGSRERAGEDLVRRVHSNVYLTARQSTPSFLGLFQHLETSAASHHLGSYRTIKQHLAWWVRVNQKTQPCKMLFNIIWQLTIDCVAWACLLCNVTAVHVLMWNQRCEADGRLSLHPSPVHYEVCLLQIPISPDPDL